LHPSILVISSFDLRLLIVEGLLDLLNPGCVRLRHILSYWRGTLPGMQLLDGRQTVDVVCAVIYDGRAWMTGDPEPMVSGHFAASLTSSRLVLTLRELLPSWPGKAPLG